MTRAELEALLFKVYPQTEQRFRVLEISPMQLKLEMQITDVDLRPGKTISGPSIFTLADCAFYALILSKDPTQVQAVTTNMSLNFLRRPCLGNLWAQARLLKWGRRLLVGDVLVFSEDHAVAHANMTYAVSPDTIKPT